MAYRYEHQHLICEECGGRTPWKRRPKHQAACSVPHGMDGLTAGEREVALLYSHGYSTTQIAARLGVSEKNIDSFRYELFHALGVRTIAALTRVVVEWEQRVEERRVTHGSSGV